MFVRIKAVIKLSTWFVAKEINAFFIVTVLALDVTLMTLIERYFVEVL